MLAFGTCNTVVMKMQDDTIVGIYEDGNPKKFTHPYF
jgi:drug/metabolite transporter (DMT)-like permease